MEDSLISFKTILNTHMHPVATVIKYYILKSNSICNVTPPLK